MSPPSKASYFTNILFLVFLITQFDKTVGTTEMTNFTAYEKSYIHMRQTILSNPLIKNKVPPSITGHDSVFMTFMPFQILSVNEIDQLLQLSALLLFFWNSSYLAWDPEHHDNLTNIYLDSDDVWLPDVVIPNGGDSPHLDFPKTVELHEDYFVVKVPARFRSTCELDLELFPFDSHNCSIVFVEMGNHDLEPAPYPGFTVPLTEHFSTTTEWKFLESGCAPIRDENSTQVTGDSTFAYTQCWITMKRRSMFYILVIIAPIIALDVMALFVFFIPPESGEKVSYIVSIFLSLSIFNVYVVEIIPRSMKHVPRIMSLIELIHLKVVLSIIATFIVVRRYHDRAQERRQQIIAVERDEKKIMDDSKTDDTPIVVLSDNCTDIGTKRQHESGAPINTNAFFKMKRGRVGNIAESYESATNHVGKKDFEGCTETKHREIGFKPLQNSIVAVRKFYSGVTATQLDMFFFVLFAIASCVIYWMTSK